MILRELTGRENMTLRRVGELAWAMGRRPRLVLEGQNELVVEKRDLKANLTTDPDQPRPIVEFGMAAG